LESAMKFVILAIVFTENVFQQKIIWRSSLLKTVTLMMKMMAWFGIKILCDPVSIKRMKTNIIYNDDCIKIKKLQWFADWLYSVN
jgi:hypothetical protein